MNPTLAIPCLLLLTTMTLGGTAWPYTEIQVTNGGHIAGMVMLKGKRPVSKAFNLITYPEPVFCGRISTGTAWRLLDQVQVNPEGGLQHAVVLLEGITKGKPFLPSLTPTIEARDCTLTPPVMVVRQQQQLQVVNMDPIIHDVQVYEVAPFGSNVMFHRPLRMNPYHRQDDAGAHDHLPGSLLIDTITFTKGRRIFYLECGFHEFMQTWGISIYTPYVAMTDEQGRFKIVDIPEGVYTLVVWHPGMGGLLDTKVVVLSNETLTVQFHFDSPKDRRMAHTTMVDNPHYGIGTLDTFGERVMIHPTHQRQAP